MWNIKYLLIFLVLLLSINFVSGYSEDINNLNPIGYEMLDNNSVVHIWNNATVSDYYFDVKSGIQLTNHYNDYWTKNVFCIGYYNNNQWNKIACADELNNFNKNIKTDNLTYVRGLIWKDIEYNNYDLRLAIQYKLGLNDEKLNITFYAENIGQDIPFDLGFGWKIKDIEIPYSEGNNRVIINNTAYYLDDNNDLVFSNMTEERPVLIGVNNETNELIYENQTFSIPKIRIDDDKYLKLNWDENLDYKVKLYSDGTKENSYIGLFINAGKFDANDIKLTTIQWVDADTPTYEGAGSIATNLGTSITPTPPTHQTDDILLAVVNIGTIDSFSTSTTGWYKLGEEVADSPFSGITTAWFWKRATSSSESGPTIVGGTSNSKDARIYVIRGTETSGLPFEANVTIEGDDDISLTSEITTLGSNRLVLAQSMVDTSNPTFTGFPPSGWTGNTLVGGVGAGKRYTILYKEEVSATTVSSVEIGDIGFGSEEYKTLTLAFIPPTGGGNNAPNITSITETSDPIVSGNTQIITANGESDADNDTLYFYCAKSANPTSGTTICTGGITTDTYPYNLNCTYTESSGAGTETVYCRVYDGTDYSSDVSTSYTVTVSDTCTCPGLASNWEIDLSDNCNIVTDCNLSTGNITFINTGTVTFNATLTTNKISFKDSVGVFEKYYVGNNFIGYVG